MQNLCSTPVIIIVQIYIVYRKAVMCFILTYIMPFFFDIVYWLLIPFCARLNVCLVVYIVRQVSSKGLMNQNIRSLVVWLWCPQRIYVHAHMSVCNANLFSKEVEKNRIPFCMLAIWKWFSYTYAWRVRLELAWLCS